MKLFAPFERWVDPFRAVANTQPPQNLKSFVPWILGEARWPIGILILASLIVGLSEAAVFAAAGILADLAIESGPDAFWREQFWPLLGIGGLLLIIRPVGMALTSAITSLVIGPGLFPMTVWRLHRHTLGQSLQFFNDDFAGRLSQKHIQTSQAITQVTIETVNALGFLFAYVLGALIIMLQIDARLALILLVWAGAWSALLYKVLPRIRAASRARAEARAGVSGQLVDSLTNISTVKLFAHAEREEAATLKSLQNFRSKALDFGRENVRFRVGLIILNATVMAVTVVSAILLWQAGQATAGLIGASTALVFRATGITGWVSMAALNIFSEIGTLEDGIATLSKPHQITDATDAKTPAQTKGAIGFAQVEFRYGRPTGGVGPLDLTIPAGQKIGLVGRSGAGKSTLISLLLRLYEPERGNLTLDGCDIRDLTQDGLRRQISVVTQETAIFNRSALDNILYGQPESGAEAAMAAARRAHADQFIADIRDYHGRQGYDAHLGERGVKLSGGQRQRIALARAILKNAPILILDEATSSLDSEVELAIQAELGRLMENKTVIAIAHRLSTIKAMDRIVVLDEGQIIEDGTHDQLMASAGLYAQLWQKQSHGFIGFDLQSRTAHRSAAGTVPSDALTKG